MTLGLNRNYDTNKQSDEHPLARATRKAQEANKPEATKAPAKAKGKKSTKKAVTNG